MTSDAADQQAPDPSPIHDLLEAFRRSKTMFAAVSLGVFEALEPSGATAAELAASLALHPAALERLLNACVALGLLTRGDGRFHNSPAASVYLRPSSPRQLTGYIKYSNDVLWKMWERLEDATREGTHRWRQVYGWEGPIFSSFFRTDLAMREFLLGMHGQGLLSSPKVVAAFDLGRFHRLVDLGGATGHLAVAACRRYPGLKAVVLDLPQALTVAHAYLEHEGLADRVTTIPGDFFFDPLPDADLFALGRILHDWSEYKVLALLERVFARLPSGGALLIAEKLLTPDRAGPPWASMQDLGMLLYTEGRERTLEQYRQILSKVGFTDIEGRTTDSPLDAVLAHKP